MQGSFTISLNSSAQGSFFTPLKLVDAFLEYDEFFALSRRKYVSPNFAEMRHVLNIAQVQLGACRLGGPTDSGLEALNL